MATKFIAGLSKVENQQLVAEWTELQQVALGTDVAIWDNKLRIGNPMLCESDGAIYHARKWYEQFFQPINEAAEESTRRFEHEIDMDYVGVKPEIRHLCG
ncbi:3-ketosteroid-9-alpha-monooxygenase oxygenase subunit [compost metagenome]